MAFQCGFFNSVNGDRKYNAEQMNNPYHRIVSNGVFAKPDGSMSDDLQVQSVEGLNVKVKEGEGIFADKWAKLDADMMFTIPTPHVTYSRKDSIIVRIDTSAEVRAGEIIYRNGEPSANPVPVNLEQNEYITEYRLANITVPANSTLITQANIEDTRPTEDCGFITHLLEQSDISATYIQWRAQFNAWFENLRATLSTVTAITSFTSKYTTFENSESLIPIQISRFNSVLDILQVYINGMILIEDVDYVINGHETITLTRPVSADTTISFIVYKSVDGTEAESVVGQINELYERVSALENNTSNLLWSGAKVMDASETVTPSKKLSECKNGWLLVWCDYDYTPKTANPYHLFTTFIRKGVASDLSIINAQNYFIIPNLINNDGTVNFCGKIITSNDTTLIGNALNIITENAKDVCLRLVYEF